MFSVGSVSAGALLGILIGAYINHLLAKSRSREDIKHQNFIKASADLREAFATELVSLSPHNVEEVDAYTFLEAAFAKHQKAITLFRPYLDTTKQKEFDMAWYEYYCQDGDQNIPFLEQYSSHIGSHSNYLESCKQAVARINKILSFSGT